MSKQKTAVEQFIEQLEEQGHSWENASIKTIEISIKVEDYLKLKQQVKEMETEQKYKFADEYCEAVMSGCNLRPEQYDNKTYGGNK